jgi:hypothetical protein
LLFSEVGRRDMDQSRLMVQSLGGDAREVMTSATDGRLLPSGQLVFMRLGTLMSVAFNLERAEVEGEPVAVMGGVMQSGLRARFGADNTGEGMFAVSSLGTLAVVKGPLTGAGVTALSWATHDGRSSSAEPTSGAPVGGRQWVRISPDGTRALLAIQTPTRTEIWFADWKRDVWTSCGECPPSYGAAVWSHDSRRLLFAKMDSLVVVTLDGSAAQQILLREAGRYLRPTAWLPGGGIVYQSSADDDTYDIKQLKPGEGAGRVVVPAAVRADAEISPDGRWLAYTTGATGVMGSSETNVIVEAFPGRGSRTQVSSGGGRNPAWSADGRTLYYLDITRPNRPGSGVFSVNVNADATEIKAGKPSELFRRPDGQGCAPDRCYDVAADGRFLFRERIDTKRATATRMDLILNWTATLPRNR